MTTIEEAFDKYWSSLADAPNDSPQVVASCKWAAYHAWHAAIEQYAAERVAGQWQPIETAPRDGSRILIHMPEASRLKVQEAYWVTPWEDARDEQCYWSTPHGPAGRGYTILPVAVTHWMPLPDAPTGEQP